MQICSPTAESGLATGRKDVCGTIGVDEDHRHPAIHRQQFAPGQEQQRPAGRPADGLRDVATLVAVVLFRCESGMRRRIVWLPVDARCSRVRRFRSSEDYGGGGGGESFNPVFSVKLERAGNYWAANEKGKHCNYGGKCIFYIAMAVGNDT